MEVGKCIICQGVEGYRDDDRLCSYCRTKHCECSGLILSNGCCAICGKEHATIEDEVARLNRRLERENGVDTKQFMLRLSISDSTFMDMLRTRFGAEFCTLSALAKEAMYIQVSRSVFNDKLLKGKDDAKKSVGRIH